MNLLNHSDNYSTICLTIFVFRGEPDTYSNRHVLVYFTSPENPNFFETVHTQREDAESPWNLDQAHHRVDWFLDSHYISHVNAGAIQVPRGEEMMPVNILASTSLDGREEDRGWNCQHFLLEGLQELVNKKLQTQEWYKSVEGDLMDHLLDGAVG